jgi:hypothetical protein
MSNRLSTGAELTKAGTDLTKCHLTRGLDVEVTWIRHMHLSLFQPMMMGRSTIHVGLISGDVKYFYPP